MKKTYHKPQTQVYDIHCSKILCMSGEEDLYFGPFGKLTERDRDHYLS